MNLKCQNAKISKSHHRFVFNANNINSFSKKMNDFDWYHFNQFLKSIPDAEKAYQTFFKEFHDIFASSFLEREKPKSKKMTPRKEWMSSGLACSCLHKSVLYKKFKNNPTIINEINYKNYRNKLKSLL